MSGVTRNFFGFAVMFATLTVVAVGSLSTAGSAAKASNDSSIYSAIEQLGPKAQANWPDEYGWIWIKPGDPWAGVHVGFSEGAEEKVAQLAVDFPYPEVLVPVTVKYSAKEMHEFQLRVIEGRKAAKRGEPPLGHVTDGRFNIGADIPAGKLIVGIRPVTPAIKQAFYAAYGHDIIFKEEGPAMPAACLTRSPCKVRVMSMNGKRMLAGRKARVRITIRTRTRAGQGRKRVRLRSSNPRVRVPRSVVVPVRGRSGSRTIIVRAGRWARGGAIITARHGRLKARSGIRVIGPRVARACRTNRQFRRNHRRACGKANRR